MVWAGVSLGFTTTLNSVNEVLSWLSGTGRMPYTPVWDLYDAEFEHAFVLKNDNVCPLRVVIVDHFLRKRNLPWPEWAVPFFDRDGIENPWDDRSCTVFNVSHLQPITHSSKPLYRINGDYLNLLLLIWHGKHGHMLHTYMQVRDGHIHY